jgi:hypothetical protein
MGRPFNTIEHIFRNLNKTSNPNGCWEWTGAKHRGYGVTRYDSKCWGAHRLAYTVWCGAIPTGMSVCHRCDNPSCCNPLHLWLGTEKDNAVDRNNKQRNARGDKIHQSKLLPKDVLEIRASSLSVSNLAKQYGIAPQNIRAIQKRQSWKHI